MKVRELIAGAEQKLMDAGIEDYKNDAWLLFEHIFQINRGKYFMIMNDDVDKLPQQLKEYEDAVSLRSTRIPLQHITGYQEFMGLAFVVNEHVLTPRPETELLVERALKECEQAGKMLEEKVQEEKALQGAELPDATGRKIRVLDMCTGSGCIAISIQKLSKVSVEVSAVDLSEKALETARKNAEYHQCEIQFTQSDLFDKIVGETFDIIVSNPPYICSEVIPTLMEEVRVHEPVMALDGSADGLEFYRKISDTARKHLNNNGRILYEIGYDQGASVAELLKENGYKSIEVIKDYAGLDRIVTAVWLPEMEE